MRVAITCRLDEIKSYGEVRISLDTAWFDLLSLISNQITVIPITQSINYKILNGTDLIVFSGGNDLSSVNDSKLSRLRDKVEKDIFNFAILNSIPMVGICRGMQFINEQLGGTLVPLQQHINQSHPLDIEAQWLPQTSLYNSFHGWGITMDSISHDLIPCAFSDNRTYIEAFRHISLPIRAVMWHPERFIPAIGDRLNYYRLQTSIFNFQ